jgi:arginyl-tRNA synthetase
MLAYQKWGNNETPESANIKGDHLIGKYYVLFDKEYKMQIEELKSKGLEEEAAKKQAPVIIEAQEMLRKWEEGDKATIALWKQMNGWVYQGFEQTYKAIGVEFDKFYYESQTYLLGKDIVEEGLQKGVFYKRPDGSVWADLTGDGLDEKLVMRSDGTSVYMTQDLGTADLKYNDFKVDKSIYVVGNEQDYHLNVLFLILKKLGRPYADGLYHLSYGMVDLPSGKMKSREGTVVDADELVEEMIETAKEHTIELGKIEGFTESEAKELYRVLGLGALKYFLLRVDPKKRMLFNPQESIDFQGNTGPFIQYTHARISAILRRAKELNLYSDEKLTPQSIVPAEKEVIYQLSLFTERIKEAAESYSPSVIAQYVYDLAKEYNRFYAEVSIFNEPDQDKVKFRVKLSELVARTIKKGMLLLGIEVPERM